MSQSDYFDETDLFKKQVQAEINQEASDESVGYVPQGYELLNEHKLVCPSCSKKLVSIIEVKKDVPPLILGETVFNRILIRARCLKCNMLSFNKEIDMCKIFYQAIAPFNIVNVDIDETNGSTILEVK